MKISRFELKPKLKCALCNEPVVGFRFNPMKEWGINGILCGTCYSKKINEHYPGDHIRVNKEGQD